MRLFTLHSSFLVGLETTAIAFFCSGVVRMEPAAQRQQRVALNAPGIAAAKAAVTRLISIGPREGGSGFEPRTVVGLPNGFAVVDAGQSAVRIYDDHATLSATLGRKGTGPGEFSQGISQALVMRGLLIVPDLTLRRYNMIDLEKRTWRESVAFTQAHQIPLYWVPAKPDQVLQLEMYLQSTRPTWSISLWDGKDLRQVMASVPGAATSSTWFGTMPVLAAGPEEGTFALLSPGEGTISIHGFNGSLQVGYQVPLRESKPYSEDDRSFLSDLIALKHDARRAKRAEMLLARVPDASRARAKSALAARDAEKSIGERYPLFADARFDLKTRLLWIGRSMNATEIRQANLELSWDDWRHSVTTWDAYGFDGTHVMRASFPPGTIITDIENGKFFGVQLDSRGDRSVAVFAVGRR